MTAPNLTEWFRKLVWGRTRAESLEMARREAYFREHPCLGHPSCALVLGYQWCTCYSPALSQDV